MVAKSKAGYCCFSQLSPCSQRASAAAAVRFDSAFAASAATDSSRGPHSSNSRRTSSWGCSSHHHHQCQQFAALSYILLTFAFEKTLIARILALGPNRFPHAMIHLAGLYRKCCTAKVDAAMNALFLSASSGTQQLACKVTHSTTDSDITVGDQSVDRCPHHMHT